MGWTLVIRIGGTLAGLTILGILFWSLSRWSKKRQLRQMETQIIEHLKSIGVMAEKQRAQSVVVRTHEDEYAVTLRHLLTIRVWLRGIQSVEIWRTTRKGKKESSTTDEMTFVVVPEPGMSLNRVPILTNLIKTPEPGNNNGLKWRGFEWGRLTLLVDRLKVDKSLNSRLRGHLETDLPDGLRITALSAARIGITTRYNPQRLPSHEFLNCIEDIADHIHDYVAEQNRTRELGKVRQDETSPSNC